MEKPLSMFTKNVIVKMKSILSGLSLCLSGLFLTSCFGAHNLTITPSVSLERANYKYIGTVSAEQGAVYVLGIGGMRQEQMEYNAYSKMVEKANLKPNQAIANISYKTSKRLYFPFGFFCAKVTTVVSGTIVEFLPEGTDIKKENRPLPALIERESKKTQLDSAKNQIQSEVANVLRIQYHQEDACLLLIDCKDSRQIELGKNTSSIRNAANIAIQKLEEQKAKGDSKFLEENIAEIERMLQNASSHNLLDNYYKKKLSLLRDK